MSAFVIPKDWRSHLSPPALAKVRAFLDQERSMGITVFPKESEIFYALQCTPYERVKVVIVGQDPYHGPGQAHGLSFSVPDGVALPPSLRNIYQELFSDLHIPISRSGNLVSWAFQGVLLLNAVLTVRQGVPLSHHGHGWEEVTDEIISAVIARGGPVVFVLWGKSAQEKCARCAGRWRPEHLVLRAAHPSPFSASHGFFGSKPFSKANAFLEGHGLAPVDWRVGSFGQAIDDGQVGRFNWDVEIDEDTL